MPRANDVNPTMKEVAAHAGVALSSVSRVLNDHPDVSEPMRERVLTSIAALGYEPNLLAASLRRGSSQTVGFIVSDIANPLFAEIVTAAQSRLNKAGYAAVVTNSNGDPSRDEELVRLLRWRQVDALVVSLADETHPGVAAELARFEGPVVLLDRRVAGLEGASAVEADHSGGMRQATNHLLALGHRRIALLTGSPNVRPSIERLAAFRDAYLENGDPHPNDLVRQTRFTPEASEAAAAEFLDQQAPPTAIIAGGNRLLVGVLRALKRRNMEPARDISLISCDDVPLSELYSPPITVIDRDIDQIGDAAAELALEQLDDPTAKPRRVILPTRLVLRDSTVPL